MPSLSPSQPAPLAISRRRPWSVWAALALLLFIAIGALPAGILLMAAPHGDPMGMSGAWIESTPFGALGGWFLPGLVLFCLIGLGSLFASYAIVALPEWPALQRLTPFRSSHWAWALLLAEGATLMIWIAVQVMLMPSFFLQPTVFVIGLLLVLLAWTPSMRASMRVAPGGRS
jgi:hypothetical protein